MEGMGNTAELSIAFFLEKEKRCCLGPVAFTGYTAQNNCHKMEPKVEYQQRCNLENPNHSGYGFFLYFNCLV
jgi:hypothetical protein